LGAFKHQSRNQNLVSIFEMNFTTRLSDLVRCLKKCSYATHEKTLNEFQALNHAQTLIQNCSDENGIVYVIGNGGSAGIASHFCNDLMKALQVASQTLYDTNLMTCLSNDLGYEEVFSYPLKKLLKPNDLLVAISSSGQSENILRAADVALERNIAVITLSGFASDNPLRKAGQMNFWIDERDYGLVEMAHFFLLHSIIDTWNHKPQNMKTHATASCELSKK